MSGERAPCDDASPNPLLVALAKADAAALSAVYREHHVAVRAFAGRLLGDESAAEDLVQEAFVALPGAVRRFRGESSLRSFILSIAVNRARHAIRSAARRRKHLALLAEEPSAGAPQADVDLVRRQLAESLFRAMDELSLEQRVAFVLCVVEERPSHEAALIIGAPAPTVRARVQAARKRLQHLLDAEGAR